MVPETQVNFNKCEFMAKLRRDNGEVIKQDGTKNAESCTYN